ncbi:hypothetical protein D3C87_1413080 [compost metagenome]
MLSLLFPSRGKTAMPMLTPTAVGSLAAFIFNPNMARIVSASRRASSDLVCRAVRITNSSPPRRATISPGLAHSSRMVATFFSTRSPSAWPKMSLTALNRSRSSASKANSSSASQCSICWCSRVWNMVRFERPVSTSWRARYSISLCASRFSVRSRMASTSQGWPRYSMVRTASSNTCGRSLRSRIASTGARRGR